MKKTASALTLISLLLVVLVVGLHFVNASPKTIIVPDDYPTIQKAIDNANHGDTVFINRGTYSNQALIVNKPISLIGEGAETTILKGQNLVFPQMSITIQIKADNVTISGFTLTDDEYAVSGGGDQIRLSSN